MIVIETTGVAEPDSMIVNISDMKGVKLDSVVCLVDADALVRFPNIGHTGQVQIENADVVILNKIDLVDGKVIAEAKDFISGLNPRARILSATYANVDLSMLFGLDVERNVEHHGEHSVDLIDSFVYRSDRVHDKMEFSKFVSSIPREIYRAKGYIEFTDGVYLFNFVSGRHHLSKEGDGKTEIVFIGQGIAHLEQHVISGLEKCGI
jgi:G3E family GTPase